MNIAIILYCAASLLGVCGTFEVARSDESNIIEYQLDGNQHVVVVVMDGVSQGEARQIARRKAAELVVAQGDRYFTIDVEQQTEVVKSEDIPQNQRFHNNLFQELIIEGDFNRERIGRPLTPMSEKYPAIRMVFSSYRERPSKSAIDACSLTSCPG